MVHIFETFTHIKSFHLTKVKLGLFLNWTISFIYTQFKQLHKLIICRDKKPIYI